MRTAEQLNAEYNKLSVPVAHTGTGLKCFILRHINHHKITKMKNELRASLEQSHGRKLSPAVKNIVWDMACVKAEKVSHTNNFEAIEDAYIEYIETAGGFLVTAGSIMGR